MPPSFRIEVLTTAHDREDFACGVEPLDRYLARQAGQDMRRRVSNCFVETSDGGTARSAAFRAIRFSWRFSSAGWRWTSASGDSSSAGLCCSTRSCGRFGRNRQC